MDRLENIDFCIRYLMQQERVEAKIPSTLEEKQLLLRALMNMWSPQPLGDEFLRAQDAELQAQKKDKGVVSASKFNFLNSRLTLWKGDITRLKVDAIVNAANSQGLGCWHPLHASIDNAIHSAAGLQLRYECNRILQGNEIATGGAIITPAYNLPARFVIHTVGPIIATDTPTAGQEEQLAACYRTSLYHARDHGCRNIAFCCISTGEFHFPNRRAAEIAVGVCKEMLRQSSYNIRVIFNVFTDVDCRIYRQQMGYPS